MNGVIIGSKHFYQDGERERKWCVYRVKLDTTSLIAIDTHNTEEKEFIKFLKDKFRSERFVGVEIIRS